MTEEKSKRNTTVHIEECADQAAGALARFYGALAETDARTAARGLTDRFADETISFTELSGELEATVSASAAIPLLTGVLVSVRSLEKYLAAYGRGQRCKHDKKNSACATMRELRNKTVHRDDESELAMSPTVAVGGTYGRSTDSIDLRLAGTKTRTSIMPLLNTWLNCVSEQLASFRRDNPAPPEPSTQRQRVEEIRKRVKRLPPLYSYDDGLLVGRRMERRNARTVTIRQPGHVWIRITGTGIKGLERKDDEEPEIGKTTEN